MSKELTFSGRQEFRNWLNKNCMESGGVWLIFGKKGRILTLSAGEALEEALCYGWIDGQMKSLDSSSYKKYFAKRTDKSVWSDKNKKMAQLLIEKGLMTKHGLDAVNRVKDKGLWEKSERISVSDEQIKIFKQIVNEYEQACINLSGMSLSIQRTYAGFYFDAKSDKTRLSRLEKIIERLNKNLKPM